MRACRSAAFRSAGLTRCGLQPVCEERGTTRRRPGVVPPDKALGARREGVRESAGSGIREISDAQGARPRRPLRRGPQQAGSRRLLPDPCRGPGRLTQRHAWPGYPWTWRTRKKPGSERMGENKEPLEDVAVISLSE